MQYMKKYIKNIVPATFMMLALGATSCIGDLDVDPIDPNIDTNVDLNGLFNCLASASFSFTHKISSIEEIIGIMIFRLLFFPRQNYPRQCNLG